jgi:hypothetical protein
MQVLNIILSFASLSICFCTLEVAMVNFERCQSMAQNITLEEDRSALSEEFN